MFAGYADYLPIDETDPQLQLNGANRRSCFGVTIFPDNINEGTEQFTLSLQFDPFLVDKAVRSEVRERESVYDVGE